MEWKDIAGVIGKAAPLLGTLVGGPAGASIGAVVASVLGVGSTPDEVSVALANPEAMVKLREIEANKITRLQELATTQAQAELAAATQNAGDINKTMQVEAGAEHWPTWSWRPFIGFAVGFNVIASSVLVLAVFVPVMFGSVEAAAAIAHLPMVLGALAGINGTVLPILGIASWYRGKMQADPEIPPPVKLARGESAPP